ncbi:MAG: phosphatase PAP2 family protein [Armatimonadetes bacterium]|nr:phosphatase PAP2 family protein [Armatimonadota bacterium]
MNLSTAALLVLAIILFGLYGPIDNPLGLPVRTLGTPLDAMIPFAPIAVYPYLSYYAFLIVTVAALGAARSGSSLRAFVLAAVVTFALTDLIFVLVPTHAPMRPAISPDGLTSRLVAWTYASLKPYNAFPSVHTSGSTLCAIAWAGTNPRIAPLMELWAAMIVLSTVLMRQHYVVDLIAGAALAWFGFRVARGVLPSRQRWVSPRRR